MINLGERAKKLASSLFGGNEVKNRIAKSTIKLLINDIITLNAEFADAKGEGALFFNPIYPNCSQYLTLKEIQNDISLAEEVYDNYMADFLKKLINMIQKEDVKKSPVVVMVNFTGLSAHRLSLESLDKRIDTLINAVS
jgi:hypothetical protein